MDEARVRACSAALYAGLLANMAYTSASPDQLAGRFNAHLLDCAMLFADSVLARAQIRRGHPEARLITEPTLAIERKG